ncbi:RNA polymerase sigma factor [Bacteroides sp. 519]|uniref:RNA polymerase sigma factor n=1 Tax=Bacteroides sp. 519 TaxID=2302937 RepID=UPI0013D66F95|nr:sigma-70 family RNA polymerase sigma factor [Bacteroides sp. 519]NDV57270.1 sigma-70 family RNA polymerase sigma factor [Bacteroides sp. 519]
MNKEINDLLQSNKKMEEVYNMLRKKFFDSIARQYRFYDAYILDDIYQDSFLSLIEAIKLKNAQIKSWKDYLFTIAKNKLMAHFKHEDRFAEPSTNNLEREVESYCDGSYQKEEKYTILYEQIAKLKSPCKEVLNLCYWEEKNMKEIAQAMGYKSEQVAKNKKSTCMEKIRLTVKEKLKREDLL